MLDHKDGKECVASQHATAVPYRLISSCLLCTKLMCLYKGTVISLGPDHKRVTGGGC